MHTDPNEDAGKEWLAVIAAASLAFISGVGAFFATLLAFPDMPMPLRLLVAGGVAIAAPIVAGIVKVEIPHDNSR